MSQMETVTALSAQWLKGKRLREEAERIMDAARDGFLSHMKQEGQSHLRLEQLDVVLVPAGERLTYPVESLRKLFPPEVLALAEKRDKREEYLRITEVHYGG